MNDKLLELFFTEDCDRHAQSVLLTTIRAKSGTAVVEDFTFNRFNVRLDFNTNQAIIDDELNPSDGEYRLSLNNFAGRITDLVSRP